MSIPVITPGMGQVERTPFLINNPQPQMHEQAPVVQGGLSEIHAAPRQDMSVEEARHVLDEATGMVESGVSGFLSVHRSIDQNRLAQLLND